MANEAYNKVQLGMNVAEVVKILDQSKKNHHQWIIRALTKKDYDICEYERPLYEKCVEEKKQCTKNGNTDDCYRKFPVFYCEKKYPNFEMGNLCFGEDNFLIGKGSAFLKRHEELVLKKDNFVIFEAEIRVLYMGPMFMHNTFEINFDREGKVSAKTKVRSWD